MSPLGVRAGPFVALTGRTGIGSVLAAIFVVLLVVGLIVTYWMVVLPIMSTVVLVTVAITSKRRRS